MTKKIVRTKTKTDNQHLADKVGLRAGHLPKKKTITVLDAFAGSGRIWRAVRRRVNKDIRVLAMDEKDIGYALPGDNLAWLKSMDLDRFDVIDLDAYGIPYDQIKILKERNYRGVIFATMVKVHISSIPKQMLIDIGFTDAMYKKAPMLCCKRGWQYFIEWLGSIGVESIILRKFNSQHSTQYYFCFKL